MGNLRLPRTSGIGGPMELVKVPLLTPRETQLVGVVMYGASNKEAAAQLGLAYGTVRVYMSRILQKTGTTNRTELAMWWWEHGGQDTVVRRPNPVDCETCPFRLLAEAKANEKKPETGGNHAPGSEDGP